MLRALLLVTVASACGPCGANAEEEDGGHLSERSGHEERQAVAEELREHSAQPAAHDVRYT